MAGVGVAGISLLPLLAAALLLAGGAAPGGDAPAPLGNVLGQVVSQGWVGGAEFSYCRSQRQAGHTTAAQYLRLTGDGPRTRVEYAATCPDAASGASAAPTCVLEITERPIPLLAEAVANGVFAGRRQRLAPADGRRSVLRFSDGRSVRERTFAGPLPSPLAALETQFDALVRRCQEAAASPASSPSAPRSIGTATMRADGTIVLDLIAAAEGGLRGEARLEYPNTHPQYQMILDHLGGLHPGESKAVPPWPDQP